MKPFGIVAYPESGALNWQGKAIENGVYFNCPLQELVNKEQDFPRAMFFSTEGAREAEMEILAKQFPKVLFCPFEIKTGIQYQIQTTPKRFDISIKGKLPA